MLKNLAPKRQGGIFLVCCSKENFINVAPERQGEFTSKSGLELLEYLYLRSNRSPRGLVPAKHSGIKTQVAFPAVHATDPPNLLPYGSV